jgi:hypothetical protein
VAQTATLTNSATKFVEFGMTVKGAQGFVGQALACLLFGCRTAPMNGATKIGNFGMTEKKRRG